MLEAVRGPQEYLVVQLRAAEKERQELRATLADARAQLTYARNTLASVDGARVAAEDDLRRLVSARSDTDHLADMVRNAISLRAAVSLAPPSAPLTSGAARAAIGGGSGSSGGADPAALAAMLAALHSAAVPMTAPLPPTLPSAAVTPASRALETGDLQHPGASAGGAGGGGVRSGMSTPLGSASSRTTPPRLPLEPPTVAPPPLPPATVANAAVAPPPHARAPHYTGATPHAHPLHALEGGAAMEFTAQAPLPAGIHYVADRTAPLPSAFLRTLPGSGSTPSSGTAATLGVAGVGPRWHRRVQA